MLLLAGEHALGTPEVSQALVFIALHTVHSGVSAHRRLHFVHLVAAVPPFTAH